MKEAICAFLFALIASCLLSSLTIQVPPYPWPVSLSDVSESSFGLKRDEGNIPEIHYTDLSRATKFMTTVDEASEERNVEWPLGANN